MFETVSTSDSLKYVEFFAETSQEGFYFSFLSIYSGPMFDMPSRLRNGKKKPWRKIEIDHRIFNCNMIEIEDSIEALAR